MSTDDVDSQASKLLLILVRVVADDVAVFRLIRFFDDDVGWILTEDSPIARPGADVIVGSHKFPNRRCVFHATVALHLTPKRDARRDKGIITSKVVPKHLRVNSFIFWLASRAPSKNGFGVSRNANKGVVGPTSDDVATYERRRLSWSADEFYLGDGASLYSENEDIIFFSLTKSY